MLEIVKAAKGWAAMIHLSDIFSRENGFISFSGFLSCRNQSCIPLRARCYWQCLAEVSSSGQGLAAQLAAASSCLSCFERWGCLCKRGISESNKGSQWPKKPYSVWGDHHALWQSTAPVIFCMHLIFCLGISKWCWRVTGWCTLTGFPSFFIQFLRLWLESAAGSSWYHTLRPLVKQNGLNDSTECLFIMLFWEMWGERIS